MKNKTTSAILSLIISFALCAASDKSDAAKDKSNSGDAPRFQSKIDTEWPQWQKRSYNYGMDKTKVPVPIFFDAPIATNSTIMVRGGENFKKRWGLHVFEAYAADDTSRITMILNKHFEEGMPVAELYYYASAYGQGLNAYNWFRIGSDVPYHSFMFSRDKAIFYGQTEFRNLIRLDNIGAADLSDKNVDWKESNKEAKKTVKREDYPTESTYRHAITAEGYKKEAKYLKVNALKKAGNGTMFYDSDYDIIVVKVGGKWKKLPVEELPEGHPLKAESPASGSADNK